MIETYLRPLLCGALLTVLAACASKSSTTMRYVPDAEACRQLEAVNAGTMHMVFEPRPDGTCRIGYEAN